MFFTRNYNAAKHACILCSLLILISAASSCSYQKKIGSVSGETIFSKSEFKNAHVGIAVFDVNEQKFLYRKNSDKYFVPASNIKIPTLYAGLKYLGNQLPGIIYSETADTIYLQPTGDPSFLHPDYKQHPVYDFLKEANKKLVISNSNWKTEALGYGWAWDDYLGYYMTERSAFPVYGNIVKWIQQRTIEQKDGVADTSTMVFTDPEVNWPVTFSPGKARAFAVTRPRTENNYILTEGAELKRELEIPFVTNGVNTALELLTDTLHKPITPLPFTISASANSKTIFSQPSDSLFKPLMQIGRAHV